MSVYSKKGKGWRYDFTLNGERYTQAWYETKTKARQAEADRRKEVLEPRNPGEILTDMGFLELVNRKLDDAAVIGIVAALLGLLLGAVATRPALIVCTALFGTALVGSGLAALAAALVPDHYHSALNHPGWLGGAGAVLLLASLVLQTALTRPPPASPAAAPAS